LRKAISYQPSAFSLKKKFYLLILAFGFSATLTTVTYAEGRGTAYVDKLFLEGRYEKVIGEADKLIDAGTGRKDELYYLKGLSELKMNRFNRARQSFEYILSRYPGSKTAFDAAVGIGDTYFLEGNLESAVKAYNEVSKKFPRDSNIVIIRQRIENCRAKPYSNITPRMIPKGESKDMAAVQMGCFKNKKNAERLCRKLAAEGRKSYVEMPEGGDRLYRVKVRR